MKKNIKSIIGAGIVIVVALAIAVVNIVGAKTEYNNGTCAECGGHFHTVGMNTKVNRTYTYECDTCGNVIVSLMRLN